LENSAGAGKIIGAKFEEIGKILKKLKSAKGGLAIAGICLDTQHSFATGYDWSAQGGLNSGWEALSKYIGFKNVKLIHANDSVSEAGSRKDRHAHLCKGKIGLVFFKKIAKFANQNNIDLICETAFPGVVEDIKILKKLIVK
jgi:endonuclease IV